jgi:hypothetical protein
VPDSQGSVPIKDEIDNYTLMRGTQNDTHTVIEFRRVLDTCDPNDYVLTVGIPLSVRPGVPNLVIFRRIRWSSSGLITIRTRAWGRR